MDSARVHLPPIQDILHRPLPLMKIDKNSSEPAILHHGRHHLSCLNQRQYDTPLSLNERYTNHTEMDSDVPPHQQPKHRSPHNRSYSDHFLRRSSASEYPVDPPRVHRRTSSDIPLNRYKCNQCLKTFSRPSSLRIHILSHTGEKPHVCPQPGCGRRFSVQSNMRRHLKVHYCSLQQQQQQQQQFQHQTFTRHVGETLDNKNL